LLQSQSNSGWLQQLLLKFLSLTTPHTNFWGFIIFKQFYPIFAFFAAKNYLAQVKFCSSNGSASKTLEKYLPHQSCEGEEPSSAGLPCMPFHRGIYKD
jgi:hypothetical protein